GIPMADKTVEEFIVAQKWNAFPLVRYTERPDIAAQHLLQGHVVVLVDTSPSIIILPTTFLDHMEHAEEYHQSPGGCALMRLICYRLTYLLSDQMRKGTYQLLSKLF